MSRIHEALRQAHQERALVLQEAAHNRAPGGVAAGRVRPASIVLPDARRDMARPERGNPPPVEDYLRFENLCAQCAKPVWKIDPNAGVFSPANAAGSGAEQFRTLRSRLYRLGENRPLRSLVVTSALAGEGKTFVASNLAQAVARQSDCRVLLIDGDLRCSRLHQLLGAPAAPGLANYLRGEASEFEIIQRGGDNDLCFIPSGGPVPDPTELLAGERLRKLLQRMAPVFEWIIIDSPPVLPVSDATMLADLCDGVLLVVRAASTSFEAAQRASREFRERNLVGVVLNSVEEHHGEVTYDVYAQE